jgi:acyl-CoA thioesterase-1
MRKNKIPFLLPAMIVSSFVLLSGCVNSNIAHLDAQGKNIVCFGDSLTFGYGAEPQESYPAQLAKMTSISVINAGINGDTTPEAIRRLETDVLDKDPLLVVIEFGGNDFLTQLPLEETAKNVEEMIKRIQGRKVMVALVDVSYFEPMEGYTREYKRLSKQYRTIFIPKVMHGIMTSSHLRSDWIHPNAKMYKLIAYRVYRGIIPYLNQNALFRRNR